MGIQKLINAFTLLELLIVISIIGILASFLLLSLSVAKEHGRSTFCKNNLKQLSLTWNLYIDDNDGNTPGNGYSTCNGEFAEPMWVVGYLNNLACISDYTNKNLLINTKYAQFANYIKTAQIYKCPSDRKLFPAPVLGTSSKFYPSKPKTRSYSLNWNLGWIKASQAGAYLYPEEGNIIKNINQINSPSEYLQFVDVYSESACWVWFGSRADKIIMFPAPYHNKVGNISYTDGHITGKKWLDDKTKDYKNVSFHSHYHPSTNNLDVLWLIGKNN